LDLDPNELLKADPVLGEVLDALELATDLAPAERNNVYVSFRDKWNTFHGGKWKTLKVLCGECGVPMRVDEECPRGHGPWNVPT
jgi:hypothetical protein